MHPLADRAAWASLERGVQQVMAREFAAAPPVVAVRLTGLRPRLVFGQHMLREAVRSAHEGIDAALLECAKLLAIRRNLARLMPHGPFELSFERFTDAGAPVCGVHALASGDRIDTLELPGDALAEVRATLPDLQTLYPDLFVQPYISVCRYLYD
jgi:hypothetical protein